MPALHSSLRSSLKNQIALISFLSDERWVMSDPLSMLVPWYTPVRTTLDSKDLQIWNTARSISRSASWRDKNI
jgi:hypothetical protein